MGYEHIELDAAGPIARLILNRPERRNALSHALMSEALDALDAVAADPAARVLVVEGRGPAFSAGHDLAEMLRRRLGGVLRGTVRDVRPTDDAAPRTAAACHRARSTVSPPQPAASSSPRATSRSRPTDARFATPGVNIGLFCSTPMVPVERAIGRKRVLEMLFTGDMIDAATAREWGLVNDVVPPETLDDAVVALADRIMRASGFVLGLGKRAFYAQDGLTEAAAYEIAAPVMVDNAQAADAHEGMRAFLAEARAANGAVADGPAPVRGARTSASSRVRARLWTGAFVSNIGTWMESIALGIYVTNETGQVAWTGTVAAAAFLPDRLLRTARRRVRRPVPAQVAADGDDARTDGAREHPRLPVRDGIAVGAHRHVDRIR